jgi:hypothetical protein
LSRFQISKAEIGSRTKAMIELSMACGTCDFLSFDDCHVLRQVNLYTQKHVQMQFRWGKRKQRISDNTQLDALTTHVFMTDSFPLDADMTFPPDVQFVRLPPKYIGRCVIPQSCKKCVLGNDILFSKTFV